VKLSCVPSPIGAIVLAASATVICFLCAVLIEARHIDSNAFPFLAAAFCCLVLLVFLLAGYIQATQRAIAKSAEALTRRDGGNPNLAIADRAGFSERLENAISAAGHFQGRPALLLVEMKSLRDVKEKLGAEFCDHLAQAAAQRLAGCIRSVDSVTRTATDTLSAILLPAPGDGDLPVLLERVIKNLSEPFVIAEHTVNIDARIGVALLQDQSDDAATLVRQAEMALCQSRCNDGPKFCIYSLDVDDKTREESLLLKDLGAAVRNEQLDLLYQPVVDYGGQTIIGVEALCRWRHPRLGDISPATFIPMAERSGDIHALGEWVLRRACLEALSWPRVSVAVNVSPKQLRQPDFTDIVQKILLQTGLEPSRLELELTEGILIYDREDALAKIGKLKELGVRLALDDFGTGYSSLSYLLSLPFDKLKIDRSFVLKLESGASGAAIVHSIVSLGRALGMHLTAEGIETREQHMFLRVAGVHSFQGYLFSRPVDAKVISARLAEQTKLGATGAHKGGAIAPQAQKARYAR